MVADNMVILGLLKPLHLRYRESDGTIRCAYCKTVAPDPEGQCPDRPIELPDNNVITKAGWHLENLIGHSSAWMQVMNALRESGLLRLLEEHLAEQRGRAMAAGQLPDPNAPGIDKAIAAVWHASRTLGLPEWDKRVPLVYRRIEASEQEKT